MCKQNQVYGTAEMTCTYTSRDVERQSNKYKNDLTSELGRYPEFHSMYFQEDRYTCLCMCVHAHEMLHSKHLLPK